MSALFLLLALVADPPQMSQYLRGTHQPGYVLAFAGPTTAYAAPDTASRRTATYQPGDTLLIIGATDHIHIRNGLHTPWYRITDPADPAASEAYVPGIELAAAALPLSAPANSTLLYAVTGYVHDDHSFPSEARLVRDGRTLASVHMDAMATMMDERYRYTLALHEEDPAGFDGLQWLGRIEFIYEACGIKNGSAYLAWNGRELTTGPVTFWVAEAGLFDYSQRAVLPSDSGGIPNQFSVIATAEAYEENTIETDTTTYTWDGVNFDLESDTDSE